MAKFLLGAMVAAACLTAPALAQGATGQTTTAQMPSLSECLAKAGENGQATQAQLDACVTANLTEIRGVVPEPQSATPENTENDARGGGEFHEKDALNKTAEIPSKD